MVGARAAEYGTSQNFENYGKKVLPIYVVTGGGWAGVLLGGIASGAVGAVVASSPVKVESQKEKEKILTRILQNEMCFMIDSPADKKGWTDVKWINDFMMYKKLLKGHAEEEEMYKEVDNDRLRQSAATVFPLLIHCGYIHL